jgi:hypothetical protein
MATTKEIMKEKNKENNNKKHWLLWSLHIQFFDLLNKQTVKSNDSYSNP